MTDDNGHRARRNDETTVAGQHRRMRRADREVTDMEQIGAILSSCDIVHVSYQDAEGLAIVPLNLAYEFDSLTGHLTLYFHSAPNGRKIDAIRAAGNALPVAFATETDCEVTQGRTLCNWGEAFKSIVGIGTASILTAMDERRKALRLLMAQQAHIADATFTDNQVLSVTTWKVESDHFTAKVRPKPEPPHSRV
ncbi:pyridoxamine 5'-phosphate oxidase family protein [Bifidobacterium oedipodis]|uniref:Flavin-nucleotide-binding protein n=1 Tax=Bifidobacterium oedipodis TaxID=2675322 RepID=A0A7Y0EQ81_9BIFI|nr:pyridoxamine 5'-phosphate oxidase family protein [Bifidobacterium sp. DSM 109957]NMM94374.1 flavin-nucleotide-binding protein [Bifidobacterium sp. DSM 109957]